MIHKIKAMNIALLLCLLAGTGNLLAQGSGDEGMFKNTGKGRIIIGGHLLFDPNSLGGTVVKDGLDAGNAKFDANGNYAGQQKVFIPDNTLLVLQNLSGGAFHTKAGGAMTAGGINIGYEKDVGDNFFYRVSLGLTTKISGGHTVSSFGGYNWYDVYWNYRSAVIPAYFGIKLNLGSRSAFYVAPGLHYYKAAWNVKGTNDGEALDAMTGGTLSRALPGASDALRPGALREDATFDASGIGVGYLIGAHTKITEKGFFFVEVETLISMKQASAGTRSAGGLRALSPYPVYPVSVAGNYYRIGYKHEL
jgi:hypothetical protein